MKTSVILLGFCAVVAMAAPAKPISTLFNYHDNIDNADSDTEYVDSEGSLTSRNISDSSWHSLIHSIGNVHRKLVSPYTDDTKTVDPKTILGE